MQRESPILNADPAIRRVLASYEARWQPVSIEYLQAAGGFSGARLWRLETLGDPLCLRCWPAEYPTQERLEFIQAVLWQVAQEGLRIVPVPIETRSRVGYVRQDGHFWQLAPWLPGRADFCEAPTPAKLQEAMRALAQFHRAAASFPLAEAAQMLSPGILERAQRLDWLLTGGGLDTIAAAIRPGEWPQLAERAQALLPLVRRAAPRIALLLAEGKQLPVPIQPVIRDIWHEHVLFEQERVSGLIDFGAMRADSVATDVARLLGSLVADDQARWQHGLTVYETARTLNASERRLVTVFDESSVLLSGLQWLEWIYLQQREFANRAAVLARLDTILTRLRLLAVR